MLLKSFGVVKSKDNVRIRDLEDFNLKFLNYLLPRTSVRFPYQLGSF